MQTQSIAEQLFFTTVRIDTLSTDGARGSGTGFFFNHKVGDNNYPFIVSNKHVVRGVREGFLSFTQRNGEIPLIGKASKVRLDPWDEMWFDHPEKDVDIAICPLIPLLKFLKEDHKVEIFYRFVFSSMIPSQAQLERLDAIEIVTFIGYPNGIWDSANLLPVARRGTTASPLSVDFEGSPRFLIDASVFGGSSGSPVFIFNEGVYSEKGGATIVGARLLFIGVVAAVFFRTQLNEIIAVPIPTQVQPMVRQLEMIDLGIVFKSRTVTEAVEAFIRSRNP